MELWRNQQMNEYFTDFVFFFICLYTPISLEENYKHVDQVETFQLCLVSLNIFWYLFLSFLI